MVVSPHIYINMRVKVVLEFGGFWANGLGLRGYKRTGIITEGFRGGLLEMCALVGLKVYGSRHSMASGVRVFLANPRKVWEFSNSVVFTTAVPEGWGHCPGFQKDCFQRLSYEVQSESRFRDF